MARPLVWLLLMGILQNQTVIGERISCYMCESAPRFFSEQCVHNVSETKKYVHKCANNINRCYVQMLSMKEVRRGCADEDRDVGYRDCLTKGDLRPFCSVCEGSLCNKWETAQLSELRCVTCKTNGREAGIQISPEGIEDTGCGSGREESLQCNIYGMQGRNLYCFVAYNVTTEQVLERGCTSDNTKEYSTEENKCDRFQLTCTADNCNSAESPTKLTCVSYSGSVNNYKKSSVRCTSSRRGVYIPGCYTYFKGPYTVEMGCNSELTISDLDSYYDPTSKDVYQFCYTNDCNEESVLRTNKCKKLPTDSTGATIETCIELTDRCFIRRDPDPPRGHVAGCVGSWLFPYSDPDTYFCTNDFRTAYHPCNEETLFPTGYLACHICSGPRCRDALGNMFKTTCPKAATHCYIAEGHRREIERGCFIPKVTKSKLCEHHKQWCVRCDSNYCNDAPAHHYLPTCSETRNVQPCEKDFLDPYADGEGYNGMEADLTPFSQYTRTSSSKDTRQSTTEGTKDQVFSCYQCHSDNFYQQTCDEDVRYLEPLPCPYLYGSRPSSCYILIHRGWMSLSRGCGSELDKYTYATCDTDLFAECSICASTGCNNRDMKGKLHKKSVLISAGEDYEQD